LLPGGAQIGGTSANFVCHARELSDRVSLASAVGDDDLGREILARMVSRGVDVAGVAVLPGRPTGTVAVTVDVAGQPSYRIEDDVAWDHIPYSEGVARLASSADIVCWGTLAQRSAGSRSTMTRFLGNVRPGVLRVFDINLRVPDPERSMVEESLALADVVKLNDEELPRVAGLCGLGAGSVESQLAELGRRYGVTVVALTRGGAGSLLWSAAGVDNHPGFAVEVVDTVGAGDAFTAELAVGVWSGWDLSTVNVRANRRAAAVCGSAGGTPVLGRDPVL
jgi:fructokinase